ncbi:hypothetical protein [Brachybacterium squillarum]|uniref:hypothetical protein n=1 Tax=Brachybacterium squillarum TaxID=661979 RepID=UPI00222323EA|nr:hypothetical protein [Brachybacterium squillarum]MCW1805290.1 hypothetical protein [Brachybacterium squillarum]
MSVVHEDPHPYAGHPVPLLMKDSTVGDEKPRPMLLVEDWADRVYGQPWRRQRSVAVLLYVARAQGLALPITDHNVLLGRLAGIPLLVHTREIDWSRL